MYVHQMKDKEPGSERRAPAPTEITRRIVRPLRAGSLRTIITGTKCKPTGVYNSVKTGLVQPYESQYELLFMKICEADWHVSEWTAQPCRFEIVDEEFRLDYFPDFQVVRSNAQIEYVEIKRSETDEVLGDVARKLDLMKGFCESIGSQFRIVDLTDLSVEPRLSNAEAIQRDAHTKITVDDTFKLTQAFRDYAGNAVPYGKAVDLLGGGIIGRKKLHSMIVRRGAAIDISQSITANTPVFRKLPNTNA